MKTNIAEIRAARGWTQRELAGRVGISRQTVSAIERGLYDPSLPLAYRIGDALDRPITEIFNRGEKS